MSKRGDQLNPVNDPDLNDELLGNFDNQPGRTTLQSILNRFNLASGGGGGGVTALEWEADIQDTIDVAGVAQEVAGEATRAVLQIIAAETNDEPIYFGLGIDAVIGEGPPIYPGAKYDSGYPPTANDSSAVSLISAQVNAGFTVRQKVLA